MTVRHLCLLGDANSVHVQRWAREMIARGWRVSVVTARPQETAGFEQIVLRPVRRARDWLWRAGEARRALDALAPDIVHAHYVTSYGWLGARSGRHPLVMTAWGSDLLVTPKTSALMRALTGWTLRHADLITGDSSDLIAQARSYRPRAAVELVHWGVEMARFHPATWDSKTGLEIVSLRSWEPNYHVGTIVEAVALLRRERPALPLTLHLLGGGPLEAALRAQVAALGLQGQVVFHGRVDDARMQAVMATCKISVTVPASDATSVAMLESMACGLAVIASDLPANREWLRHARDAALDAPLVAPGDAAALARALSALARDEERIRRLGEANRAHIERDGRRDVQMDRMAALYQGLLASR